MNPLRLDNPIQRYAWGSKTAIPALIGAEPDGQPWAEVWMGAHPRAPSRALVDGASRPLDALIREQPRRFLGDPSRADTTLPYLFKVLAAAQPLSIQCHPDDGQAAAGFAREQAAGIPRHAPHRLYPDPRAKPELVVARTPFVGLKGFRSVDDLQRRLRDYGLEALAPAAGVDEPAALQSTFSLLMRANPDQQKRWATQATEVAAHRHEPEAEVIRQLRALYPNDPGVLAPLFLNLVTLAPGQALFLEARELHAYLQGTALEIMANSDNVLRGGLTQKHMDVDELMSVLDFTPRPPAPLTPVAETVGGGWQVYPTTTPQFGLRVGTVRPSGALARPKPTCLEIVLCTDGEVALSAPDASDEGLVLKRGQSAAIPCDGPYVLRGEAEVFLATEGPAVSPTTP